MYFRVSSVMRITEQTEVSLKSAMKSFVTGGITMRNACGTITVRIAVNGRHAERERGFHLPLRNGEQPGPVVLRFVCRVVDRQAEDAGVNRLKREHGNILRKHEEEKVELQHERRAADHFDKHREREPHPAWPIDAANADQHARDHRERE